VLKASEAEGVGKKAVGAMDKVKAASGETIHVPVCGGDKQKTGGIQVAGCPLACVDGNYFQCRWLR